MRPLFIDESCLQCHADQDYVVGSLGGGISESVPMAPLWAIARPTMLSTSLGFGILWLLGLAGLRGSTLRLGESLRERDLVEEKLRRRNEELKAFTDSVSHDLRAPVRAINEFAKIILDEHADQLDQEGARLLNVVRENCGLMGTLIEGLLELSRLDRQVLEPRKLNMNELVEEVIQDLESQTPDSRREVTLGPLPSARGDHTLIRQVWFNLLSNAVKFSCSRDVSRIQVDGRITGEGSTYWVKDNGAGFEMASAEKLFNVFKRLHSGEEFEGTGVGLSIVKRIVERHGGRVWAEGKVDEGATLWFTIPVSEGVLERTASG
jgi:two-component system sensor kinase